MRTPGTRGIFLGAFLAGLVLHATASGQRTRADAIAFLNASVTLEADDICMAPQSPVLVSDSIAFRMGGAAILPPVDSWLIWVDYEPNQDFEHPTEVFLVPVDAMDSSLFSQPGDAWIEINGQDHYSDVELNLFSPDHCGGTVLIPMDFPPPPPPPPVSNPNACGLIVSGSTNRRHQTRNVSDLKCALSEVPSTNWLELGTGGSIPSEADICTALGQIASNGNCEKFYFVFTGHGGFNKGMHLETPDDFLTGCELADKINGAFGSRPVEVCLVISACFSGQVLADACPKFMAANRVSSGIASTAPNKTGIATVFPSDHVRDFTHFSRALKICRTQMPPPVDEVACINQQMAMMQPTAKWRPRCYPQKTRSSTPEEMESEMWVVPKTATVAPYNSSTLPNPDILLTSPAIIGQTFTATVTLGLGRPKAGTWIVYLGSSMIAPPTGVSIAQFSGGLNFGTSKRGRMLLCGIDSGGFHCTGTHSGVSGSTSSPACNSSLPYVLPLVCRTWCAQAIVLGTVAAVDGGGNARLTSAVHGVVGHQ